MNCSYRSIWNETTGTFVAASENAKGAGKKVSSCSHATGLGARFALKALSVSLLLSFGANLYALPTGGVVAAGSASISSTALTSTITQSSQNAAINWQGFNIASGEAVRFAQPNSNSVMLNRVLGSDPSAIFGSLSANGKVFLVNPNGILFGQGASVNVAGLVASTLNIADSDFMAGNYKFSGSGSGAVVNQGSIQADGGFVALLGASVSNEGVILAKLGTVALTASPFTRNASLCVGSCFTATFITGRLGWKLSCGCNHSSPGLASASQSWSYGRLSIRRVLSSSTGLAAGLAACAPALRCT